MFYVIELFECQKVLAVGDLFSLRQMLLKLWDAMEFFIGSSYRALKINKPLTFLLISIEAAVA